MLDRVPQALPQAVDDQFGDLGRQPARRAAVAPPHRDAAGRGEGPALGDQRQIESAPVRYPAQVGERRAQFGSGHAGDRLDLGQAVRQQRRGRVSPRDRRASMPTENSVWAMESCSRPAISCRCRSAASSAWLASGARWCSAVPASAASPSSLTTAMSPGVRAGPDGGVEQGGDPVRAEHRHADDAVDALDIDGGHVVRGDQRGAGGSRAAGPAHRCAAPARPARRPVLIRSLRNASERIPLVDRHRELAVGVPDRGRGDVHPGDHPGTRNQGADDGLGVLVQPDGGRGGCHPSTVTGSAP